MHFKVLFKDFAGKLYDWNYRTWSDHKDAILIREYSKCVISWNIREAASSCEWINVEKIIYPNGWLSRAPCSMMKSYLEVMFQIEDDAKNSVNCQRMRNGVIVSEVCYQGIRFFFHAFRPFY